MLKVKLHHHLRQIAIIFVFLNLSACSPSDAENDVALQLSDKALQSNRAWEILESLTTEIGPRLAGTEANERAVIWAQAMLQASGFDKVWLEPVTFPVWRRFSETARVMSPYPQELKITALGYSGSTDGEMLGELIKFESLAELQDVDSDTVRGKIVFLNQATERSLTGAGYGATVGIRGQGPQVAKEKGAMGVLIRSVGTDSHRLPHTGATTRIEDPLPSAALSVPDADQLVRIMARGEKVIVGLHIQVSEQQNGASHNVVAQITGATRPQEILLLGAHLDSWDLGTGALDDGAGVAIITAAAQLIAELPEPPARTIRVVLFANEEQNLWGARAYADAHHRELENHIFASESDFGAGAIWQFDTGNQDFLGQLKPVLDELNIALGTATADGGPDMIPIAQLGVPVVRLRQDGSDYFDYHHTANDTLDKVNPETLKQNVAAWAAIYYTAANSDHVFRD
jgi:Zn-dependent M28 family amino/carboxypeptidase